MDAASLPNDVALCHQVIVEQIATLEVQSATLAVQQREIEQLKHYVALLLRARYGPRSEKVDPNQLALFDLQGSEETAPEPGPISTICSVGHRCLPAWATRPSPKTFKLSSLTSGSAPIPSTAANGRASRESRACGW